MTKSKKCRLTAIVALSVTAALFVLCGIMAGLSAFAERNVRDVASVNLEEYYFKGDVLTPPAADLSYGGETKAAVTQLVYPSGKARSAENYRLDEAGKYTLRYIADFSGVPVEEEKNFVALQHLYEFSGGKVKRFLRSRRTGAAEKGHSSGSCEGRGVYL